MNKTHYHPDTICAIATAPGRGGVGIVRVSGPSALSIAQRIAGFSPKNRYAHHCHFVDSHQSVMDEGILIYFQGPHSFTGEDVVEFQGHGGPVVLDMLVEDICRQQARLALPGEFSQRAFLNDKLDLSQAEAIADLINANSRQAAKNAVNSLSGEFSRHIEELCNKLIHLRMYVESAIDFPEEEVDFLADAHIATALENIIQTLEKTLLSAQQGQLRRDGMKIVIAGRPNAGKSSLLNILAGEERAIVSDIPGTTRDTINEHIHIDGMPLHIIDTAGLRETDDTIEKIGVEKARQALIDADRTLLMVDAANTPPSPLSSLVKILSETHQDSPLCPSKITVLLNKTDKLSDATLASWQTHLQSDEPNSPHNLTISAKNCIGIDALRQHLKTVMGFETTAESAFSARRRHLEALQSALQLLKDGQQQLLHAAAGELLAEDLRIAHDALGSITGKFSADDLLGEIFSNFCIGK